MPLARIILLTVGQKLRHLSRGSYGRDRLKVRNRSYRRCLRWLVKNGGHECVDVNAVERSTSELGDKSEAGAKRLPESEDYQ